MAADSASRSTVPDLRSLSERQRRAIRGWCMYDWANSAFATSLNTAILPVYFVTLFKDAFGSETQLLGFTLTGSSTWALGVAVSSAVVALSSPALGVVADRTKIKKTLLWAYTLAGAAFTFLLFFSAYTGEPWAFLLGCYVIANIGFAGGNVFYNSLLPHLAPKDLLDDVSSRGFAFGYVGGGLLLAVHLALILAFRDTDHSDLVTRVAIASVGFWWFGWAIWTFRTVPEPDIPNPVAGLTAKSATRIAFTQLRRTFHEITQFRVLALFLVAYLLFNDGIQTVLSVAGAFGADTLGISLVFNVATILVIQFIAALGAMLFSRISRSIGTKKALVVALAGWCVAILLGVGFAPLRPESHGDFNYQLEYLPAGTYELSEAPDIADDDSHSEWNDSYGHLSKDSSLSQRIAAELAEAVGSSELSHFSISIDGGALDGTRRIGPHHPSNLSQGPIDWWPRVMRSFIWGPSGISVNFQWLILGAFLGTVLGGSQALARGLFAQMVPERRSSEFFGFFGFVGRASAVFGPMIYLFVTGFFDTRLAILAILVIIVAGTAMLRWVDVKEGRNVAMREDERLRANV